MMVRENEKKPFFSIFKKCRNLVSKNFIETNFTSFNEKFECCNANYNKFYNFSAVLILLKTL